MAVVTVVGASGSIVSVSVDGAAALSLAKTYAAAVNAAVSSGSLFASNVSPLTPAPTVPAGFTSEAVLTGSGIYSLPGYSYITDPLATAAVIDESSIGSSTSVLAGIGGTVVVGGSGGGEFIAGGGNNIFSSLPMGSGDYTLGFGNGSDTILAFSGNDVISDGVGKSLIFLGTGNSQVKSYGSDSIVAGSGRDTITLYGSSSTVIGGTTGVLVNALATKESIVGGTGADTFLSSSGNNTLTGGTGQGNFFEFTKSATGGNFTVTDFASSAGNLVGLFGYGANEVATALNSAKDIPGGAVIQLSNNSTITFSNVSADYLKQNAFKFVSN